MEHKWVKEYSFPAERNYIIAAYIAYGTGGLIINGTEYTANAQVIYMINPGAAIKFFTHDKTAKNYNYEIHFILFQKEILFDAWEKYAALFPDSEAFFTGRSPFITATDDSTHSIRNEIVRMLKEYYEDAPGRTLSLTGHMLVLMPLIFRRTGIRELQSFTKNTLVAESIRYIHSSIYKNPKPRDVAANRYVTTEHLSRMFKKELGMTVTQYINGLRIEMTKDILINTDRAIENIAILFNMKTKSLQQLFKRSTGMSMREYRRINKR